MFMADLVLHLTGLGRCNVIWHQGQARNDIMLHRMLVVECELCPQSCLVLDGLILQSAAIDEIDCDCDAVKRSAV